ncbi:hypothetical protein K7432_002209 [Basidiobolus ranarum]|uniref:Centromere protein K n=1 Tax=Basidiobolus ranarum TaxID=34480 RepID=A0ABR2X1W5_9FUNG
MIWDWGLQNKSLFTSLWLYQELTVNNLEMYKTNSLPQPQNVKVEYQDPPLFTEPFPPTSTKTERDIENEVLIDKLKSKCEQSFQILLELKERVNLPKKRETSISARRIAILLSEEQRLANELDQQREELTIVEEKAPGLSRLQAQEALKLTNQNYLSALPLLRQEQEEIDMRLMREKEKHESYQQMNTMLLGKLHEIKEKPPQNQEDDLIRSRGVQEEILRFRKLNARVMTELVKFVEVHFPPVLVYKGRQMSDEERTPHTNRCSLKVILEDLMNSAVTRPNDSYIQLDPDACWKPYIELLVRGGIAARHPQDPHRLKLIEFHL